MAGTVNKVIIIGYLGKDPEIKSFPDGQRYCNLSVATSESWKDKRSGDWKERTEWHRIVVSNERHVDHAERALRKGSKVYLEGQIQSREYEKGGQRQFVTEIVLKRFRGELTSLDKTDNRPPGRQPGRLRLSAIHRGWAGRRNSVLAPRNPRN